MFIHLEILKKVIYKLDLRIIIVNILVNSLFMHMLLGYVYLIKIGVVLACHLVLVNKNKFFSAFLNDSWHFIMDVPYNLSSSFLVDI